MSEKHAKDGVFTPRDVIRIRKEIGTTPTEVFAKEFGVTPQCIFHLATGVTHQDMNKIAPPAKMSNKTLKAEQKRKRVAELLQEGYSQAEVSRMLKISQTYVSLIVRELR